MTLRLLSNSSLRCFLCTQTRQNSGPVQLTIEEKLKQKFKPSVIQVECESHKHNVPRGAEKHFRVLVVSSEFDKLTLPMRHRLVYSTLKHELNNGVHALRIDAYTNTEYNEHDTPLAAHKPSPDCRGGAKL